MSENAGVILRQRGDPQMLQEDVIGVRPRTMTRSGVIMREAHEITEKGRFPGDYHLYSPFARAEMDPRRFEPIPKAKRQKKRLMRRNPLLPTRSYIPESVVMEDSPALNVADPTEPNPYEPINDVPDLTVANSLTEERNVRNQVRDVRHYIDTRAQQRRLVRRVMQQIVPTQPRIVDIKAHRAKQMPDMAAFLEEQKKMQMVRG